MLSTSLAGSNMLRLLDWPCSAFDSGLEADKVGSEGGSGAVNACVCGCGYGCCVSGAGLSRLCGTSLSSDFLRLCGMRYGSQDFKY